MQQEAGMNILIHGVGRSILGRLAARAILGRIDDADRLLVAEEDEVRGQANLIQDCNAFFESELTRSSWRNRNVLITNKSLPLAHFADRQWVSFLSESTHGKKPELQLALIIGREPDGTKFKNQISCFIQVCGSYLPKNRSIIIVEHPSLVHGQITSSDFSRKTYIIRQRYGGQPEEQRDAVIKAIRKCWL